MIFVIIFSIILLSLFALFPSFNLGLYGDDWLEIWKYFYHVERSSNIVIDHLANLFTRYGSFDLIMGFVYQLFGFEAVYYFIAAYILRILAAVSFYPIIFYVTKNKFAAFFSVLFFAVTAIGLDATNWVFNMPAYLAVAFFNLFLLFYLRSKFEANDKLFVVSLLLIPLAITAASVRMTGLLPLILLTELFWLLRSQKFEYFKKFRIRIAIILLLFFLMSRLDYLANSFRGTLGFLMMGSTNEWFGHFGSGISQASNLINQGKYEFIFYPLIIIGNMVLPINLNQSKYWVFIILGIMFLGLIVWLFFKNRRDLFVSTWLLISLLWLLFSLFPWVRDPSVVISYFHRYMIVSVLSLIYVLAFVIKQSNKYRLSKLIISLSLLLVLINVFSSRSYLKDQVENVHGSQLSEKIWSQIPYIPEIGKSKQPIVFHFTGEERGIIHGNITFGFPFHIGLIYDLDNYLKMPVPMDEWKQVVSAVTDGKSFEAYAQPVEPIPVENVYAFKLEGKDKLINITEQVRNQLRELKNSE